MSGIFGIINTGSHSNRTVSPADLQRMQGTLIHRGRDGSGLWQEGEAGLGHLATHITPESIRERLPFAPGDGRFVITADARIDNRAELVDQLFPLPPAARGALFENPPPLDPPQKRLANFMVSGGKSIVMNGCHRNAGLPDSLLILAAYQKWGQGCPGYIVGEFAFAIWDRQARTLFCARDHLGVRPFFYYSSPGFFAFASEIKGIRALDAVPGRFNETALAQKLLPLEPDFRETFFKGIMRLKAAHGLQLQARAAKYSTSLYWDPRQCKPVRYGRDSDYADALRELTAQAVHSHLRTLPRIRAAVGLSGGLDSSALACIAARKLRENNQRLLAISSVLPEDHKGIETDERRYIREVLEQEDNIDIRYVTAEETGPFNQTELETGIRELEAPVSAFHYMDRALCHAARQNGADLLLWGLGGDSLSSHDGRHALYHLAKNREWGKARELIRQIHQVEGIPSVKLVQKKILLPMIPGWLLNLLQRYKRGKKDLEIKINSPVTSAFALKYGISPGQWGKGIRPSPPTPHEGFLKKHRAGRFLVEKENIRHAHLGLISGFPYWDKRIVEFSLGVPPEQFLAGGWKRSLFRRAMEGILPPSIRWRRDKHVFVPDFHRRVLAAKPVILEFLDSVEEEEFELMHQYIDLQRIRAQLDRIRPVQGRGEWETATQGIVMKGVIVLKFLQWISKETRLPAA